MMTPQERYRQDATFRTLVDILEGLLHEAKSTPTELRDALMLALIHHEETALRSWRVTRDPAAPYGLRLDPEPPPWARKDTPSGSLVSGNSAVQGGEEETFLR